MRRGVPADDNSPIRPSPYRPMSATHDSTRQTPQHEQTDEQIRAVAETYELEDAEVTMIKDPENPHAWIQSNATVTLLR